MAERKLKQKRKRRSSGRAIRISNAVVAYLEKRRLGIRSYDALLRRLFGLDDWRGNPQPLAEGVLEVTTGRFYLRTGSWDMVEAEANGAAVVAAVKLKTKKVNKPIRMREIP